LFAACSHHLYLDIQEQSGGIKVNFPDIDPDEMTVSCALDVADEGGATLDRCGAICGLTRERIRQIEEKATDKVAAASPELAEVLNGWAYPKGFSEAGG